MLGLMVFSHLSSAENTTIIEGTRYTPLEIEADLYQLLDNAKAKWPTSTERMVTKALLACLARMINGSYMELVPCGCYIGNMLDAVGINPYDSETMEVLRYESRVYNSGYIGMRVLEKAIQNIIPDDDYLFIKSEIGEDSIERDRDDIMPLETAHTVLDFIADCTERWMTHNGYKLPG